MPDHMIDAVKITSAYIVLSLYVIVVVFLLSMTLHLIHMFRKKHRNHSAKKALKMFIIVTICGIMSFKLSSILEILVILQTILIDAHALHDDVNWISHFYYDSFDEMEYLIAIFDTIGHLCLIFVFILRFEYTFGGGSIFGSNTCIIATLKSILFALFVCSVGIILLIIFYHKTHIIIICEIIWELFVEIMCLWLLYLFTSKLYLLLKISLTNHIKSGNSTDFFIELTKTIKHSLNSSKEKSTSGHSGSKQKTKTKTNSSKNKNKNKNKSDYKSSDKTETQNSFRIHSMNTMTIDGMIVVIMSKFDNNSEPDLPDQSQPNSPLNSPVNSPVSLPLDTITDDMVVNTEMNVATLHNYFDTTPKPTPEPTPDADKKEDILHEEKELEFEKSQKDFDLTVSHTANTQTNKTKESGSGSEGKSMNGAVDLVSVMNKMTLLVLMTVLTSTLSVIGNIFIEIHELQTIEKHTVDVQSIWASILPLIDNIVTCFMLYLQFNFTDKIYRMILGKLDVLFLNAWLNILRCFWSTEKNNEKTMSFLFANKMQRGGDCDEDKNVNITVTVQNKR